MESPVIGESVMVCYFGYIVTGLVKSLHGLKECLVLFWVRCQLNEESKLHLYGLDYSIVNMGFSPFPPTAEAVGILGGIR